MANSTTHAPYSVCDFSLESYSLCTPQTCCLAQGQVGYFPSLGGNGFYLSLFILLVLLQFFLGIRYRTWGFLVGMASGTLLEILGYAGRIMLHQNIFDNNAFLLYLITLTIGPAFLTASIYLCLSRLILTFGSHLSRFQPRTYTITFVIFDFIALLLQAIGGAIASIAKQQSTEQTGINIMIAGLSWQVISLFIFMVLCAEFAWRVKHSGDTRNMRFASIREQFKFKAFLWALPIATIAIFIRCVFRVAELQQGFHGSIANSQALFMIFEGPMIIIAVAALTVFHPGRCFGEAWHASQWSLRGKKNNADTFEIKSMGQTTPPSEMDDSVRNM